MAAVGTESQVLEGSVNHPVRSSLADSFDIAYKGLFDYVEENPDREGLQETPRRVVKALIEMTQGYFDDPSKILSKSFESDCDEMVVVKAIPFISLCEHHLLPFFGYVDVAYLPNGRVLGLSKIPRAVQALAQRLQIQERLTQEIAEAISENVKNSGVAVKVRATHSCMKLRGVQSDGEMVTCKLLGNFKEPVVRAEFFELVK